MGFLYTRKEAYDAIKAKLSLPLCNEGMEDALYPYFKSFVAEQNGAPSYLVYHRAFCERARQAGVKVFVDTRIRASVIAHRLWQWEDVIAGGKSVKPKSEVTARISTIEKDYE